MKTQLNFPIANKTFRLVDLTKSYKLTGFAQYIGETKKLAQPQYTIELKETNEPSFRLAVISPNLGQIYFSRTQKLPDYGYFTLLYALIQALLIDQNIFLFHGLAQANNIWLKGTDSDWFATWTPTQPFERLAIVERRDSKNWLYPNLNLPQEAVEIGEVIGLKRAENQNEFLFQSTWFYLFFEHFFANRGANFLPTLMSANLRDRLVALRIKIHYNKIDALPKK